MSLVGRLEDLGLEDILQIVSLSRKSGLLLLCCDGGEGRIALLHGQVAGAAIKGELADLRDVLLRDGTLDSEAWASAVSDAGATGTPVEDAIVETGRLSRERIETLRREGVEAAVLTMFGWRSGEFTFEVRERFDADEVVLLPSGINSQYLAIEATRRDDENAWEGEGGSLAPSFSGDDDASLDTIALATARRLNDPHGPGEGTDDDHPVGSIEPSGLLVVIDPDLAGLEWLKASLESVFQRVHIFQRSETGVDRIRHYLGRGVVPVVLVSARATRDPVGGTLDAPGLMRRLRSLAPSMPIVALYEEGRDADPACDVADAIAFRPGAPGADGQHWDAYESTAEQLRSAVAPWADRARRGEPAPRARVEADTNPLVQLKSAGRRLRELGTPEDVLELVLDFAAGWFARAVVFRLRDGTVQGHAQRGLPAAGGPSDEDVAAIAFEPESQPELFRRVMERRSAVTAPPAAEADRRLASLLGAACPRRAFVAPLESAGSVVALLYADNLPHEAALPDTTALEILLLQAGLVLDRLQLTAELAPSPRSGS